MHPNVSWQPEGLALAKCTNHALHSFRPIFGGVEGFCEKEQRRMRNKRDTRDMSDMRDMRDKSRKSLGGWLAPLHAVSSARHLDQRIGSILRAMSRS